MQLSSTPRCRCSRSSRSNREIRGSGIQNPTLLVLTDRNDLDDQLFGQFQRCADILGQTPVQAGGREHLRELLNRASGGVVFTTIQKFLPLLERGSVTRSSDETSNAAEHSDANDIAECSGSQSLAPSGKMPALSARKNIVVIADEAHPS